MRNISSYLLQTSKPDFDRLCLSYQDPFEDYKSRLAKKLAKKAEAEESANAPKVTEKKDDMNWFGMKLGAELSNGFNVDGDSVGVGRYLSLKRPAPAATNGTLEETGKKRKLGFGSFDNF